MKIAKKSSEVFRSNTDCIEMNKGVNNVYLRVQINSKKETKELRKHNNCKINIVQRF